MNFCIHVVDDDEDSVPGIRVAVHAGHNLEETTDEDGNAWFEIDDDRDSVQLYIDGCDYGEIEPEDGESETYHLRDGIHYMEWTIRVLDQDGDPVEGAEVSVWNGWKGRKDDSKDTDSDGCAFFRGLKQSGEAEVYINGSHIGDQSLEDGGSYDFTIEVEKEDSDDEDKEKED